MHIISTEHPQITKNTIKSLAAATVLSKQNLNLKVTKTQFKHSRHIEIIISKLVSEFLNYESLAGYIYEDSQDVISSSYVKFRVLELCLYCNLDENTVWTLSKWRLLILKIYEFQATSTLKWEGVFEQSGNVYYFVPRAKLLKLAKESHTLTFENIASLNALHNNSSAGTESNTSINRTKDDSQSNVVPAEIVDIKTDYLMYLVEKIRIKFGPQANQHLNMAFCKFTTVTSETLGLTGSALDGELKSLYQTLKEEEELSLVNLLVTKLLN